MGCVPSVSDIEKESYGIAVFMNGRDDACFSIVLIYAACCFFLS